MLFSTYEFMLIFLPVTLGLYALLMRRNKTRQALFSLTVLSMFFYAWWNPWYLLLIVGSMVGNFYISQIIVRTLPKRISYYITVFGIGANLAVLGYFKYANFFVDNINILFSTNLYLDTILLPLAISFFTFQQISFLVDSYQGVVEDHDFLNYCLFVTFFPQLIAGPIVHHKEMMPQFAAMKPNMVNSRNLAIGLSIFLLGLAKKVLIADNLAPFADDVFQSADLGTSVGFLEAWSGALCYTFQLYFDFSGYADMAIGLALMFGIRLPINFNSPYKSTSIIDFWRRWHMTLSRFLRDYLYIALGGNRHGSFARYRNLMITMLLGGLWHGAGWNFVIWGGLHGIYLVFNHLWRAVFPGTAGGSLIPRKLAWVLTMLAVVVAWVFFRATSVEGALTMLSAMMGQGDMVLPLWLQSWMPNFENVRFDSQYLGSVGPDTSALLVLSLLILTVFVAKAPNLPQLFGLLDDNSDRGEAKLRTLQENQTPKKSKISWAPNKTWALSLSFLTALCLVEMKAVSVFLYFNF